MITLTLLPDEARGLSATMETARKAAAGKSAADQLSEVRKRLDAALAAISDPREREAVAFDVNTRTLEALYTAQQTAGAQQRAAKSSGVERCAAQLRKALEQIEDPQERAAKGVEASVAVLAALYERR